MLNIVKSNNPCAIRNTKDQWEGKIGSSRGFVVFISPIHGVRAGMRLLKNGYLDKGYNTLEKIFTKYAPVGDFNNPIKYANRVLEIWKDKSKLKPMSDIRTIQSNLTNNSNTIYNLVYAIIEVETGGEFQKYFDKNLVLQYAYNYFVSGIEPTTQETPNGLFVITNNTKSVNLKLSNFESLAMNGGEEKKKKKIMEIFFMSVGVAFASFLTLKILKKK